jgi:hypothetical protein
MGGGGHWWHNVCTIMREDYFRHFSNIIVITVRNLETTVLVLLTGKICEVSLGMILCGIVHTPNFMKNGICVQARLRYYLLNFRCFNVGITNGRDI